jgi:hypothetical protein
MTARRPEYQGEAVRAVASSIGTQYVVTTYDRSYRPRRRSSVRRHVHGDVLGVLRRLRRLPLARDCKVDVFWGPASARHWAEWSAAYIVRARREGGAA